jgi:hypothetical protein
VSPAARIPHNSWSPGNFAGLRLPASTATRELGTQTEKSPGLPLPLFGFPTMRSERAHREYGVWPHLACLPACCSQLVQHCDVWAYRFRLHGSFCARITTCLPKSQRTVQDEGEYSAGEPHFRSISFADDTRSELDSVHSAGTANQISTQALGRTTPRAQVPAVVFGSRRDGLSAVTKSALGRLQ